MKTLFLAPIILVLLAWTASVSADPTPAITAFEGVSSARVADCCTLGWEFTLTQDITVTHLGIYDYDDDNGFDSHDIGLWQVSGVLSVGLHEMICGGRYLALEPACFG